MKEKEKPFLLHVCFISESLYLLREIPKINSECVGSRCYYWLMDNTLWPHILDKSTQSSPSRIYGLKNVFFFMENFKRVDNRYNYCRTYLNRMFLEPKYTMFLEVKKKTAKTRIEHSRIFDKLWNWFKIECFASVNDINNTFLPSDKNAIFVISINVTYLSIWTTEFWTINNQKM